MAWRSTSPRPLRLWRTDSKRSDGTRTVSSPDRAPSLEAVDEDDTKPPAAVATFLDALTGPSPLDRVVSELRESGEFPEVLPALERGDHELALRVLLEEVDHAEGERRDRIRELMVLLFAELGQDHPLSLRYRRKLAAALY